MVRKAERSATNSSIGQSQPEPTNSPAQESSSDDQARQCRTCGRGIAANESALNCDICGGEIHVACSGMGIAVVKKLNKIIEKTGWVCPNCRGGLGCEVSQLKEGQARLTAEVASLKALVDRLSASLDNTHQSTNGVQINQQDHGTQEMQQKRRRTSMAPPQTWSEVVTEVISDVERRKKNIIVSGLREGTLEQDIEIFEDLCAVHLSSKPRVNRAKSHRIGKPGVERTQPRRLLLHYDSEVAAQQLLSQARELRRADDAYIAGNVYINADLNPTQSKLAFEQRKRRRSKQQENARTDQKKVDQPGDQH